MTWQEPCRLAQLCLPRLALRLPLCMQAEIQSFYADGSMALHTRSTKYGKVGIMWLHPLLFSAAAPLALRLHCSDPALCGSASCWPTCACIAAAALSLHCLDGPRLAVSGLSALLSCTCVSLLQLAEGILVEIPAKLIKRQKQHFVNLDGLGELGYSPSDTADCLKSRLPVRGPVVQSAAEGLEE